MTGRFWNFLCGLLTAGAIALLLAGAARAQMPMPGINLDPDSRPKRALTQEEKDREKAIEDKYRSTMQSMPDKKAPADPWGNIRSAPSGGSR